MSSRTREANVIAGVAAVLMLPMAWPPAEEFLNRVALWVIPAVAVVLVLVIAWQVRP